MTALVGFEEFVRSYQDMVYTTAFRLLRDPALSEDIAQDVFLKAWERFSEVRAYEAPGGWLKTVATNLCLNYLTRHRNRWDAIDVAEDMEHPEPSASSTLETRERLEALEQALAALPAHQRVPLVLFHFNEMPYEEIAAKMQVSLSKIKSDIFRGREALRRALEGAAR